jgi:hypothetical protein
MYIHHTHTHTHTHTHIHTQEFFAIETVCVVAFTFEYIARFIVVPASFHNDGMKFSNVLCSLHIECVLSMERSTR